MNDELTRLIEAARGMNWTPETKAAQVRSWAIGELMMSHPDYSREQAEAILDRVIANKEAFSRIANGPEYLRQSAMNYAKPEHREALAAALDAAKVDKDAEINKLTTDLNDALAVLKEIWSWGSSIPLGMSEEAYAILTFKAIREHARKEWDRISAAKEAHDA